MQERGKTFLVNVVDSELLPVVPECGTIHEEPPLHWPGSDPGDLSRPAQVQMPSDVSQWTKAMLEKYRQLCVQRTGLPRDTPACTM